MDTLHLFTMIFDYEWSNISHRYDLALICVQLSEIKKKLSTSNSTFSHVCKTCERIRIRVIAKLLLFNGCNMSTVFVDLLPISLQWVYLDNYGSKHPNY